MVNFNNTVFASISVLLLAFLMPVQYSFGEKPLISTTKGFFATADWIQNLDENHILFTAVYVTETNKGTDILLIRDLITRHPDGTATTSDLSGHLFTEEDVFDIDKRKLAIASLAASVPVCTIPQQDEFSNCLEVVDTFDVNIHWIGQGELEESRNKFMFRNDDFMILVRGAEIFRDTALATGELEGQDLGDSNFTFMNKFRLLQIEKGENPDDD